MNERNPTPPVSKARPSLFHYITLGAALLGVFLLWRQQAETRQNLLNVLQKNKTLQAELQSAQAELSDMKSGDSSAATRQRLAAVRSAKPSAPEEETETLVLQAPTVHQTADGLVVHFEFKPVDGIELPDDIILAVRVPMSSSSKLLALKPVSAPENAKIRAVINPAGYIGFIQGSPADLGNLAFEFTVSAPVKATVSGSDGIVDFEFDISQDGCTVRKL